jgi:hypothetical protein
MNGTPKIQLLAPLDLQMDRRYIMPKVRFESPVAVSLEPLSAKNVANLSFPVRSLVSRMNRHAKRIAKTTVKVTMLTTVD